MFNYFGKGRVIIAKIASPQSIRNINENENVCISFIDILVQNGFQLKGKAKIIGKNHASFPDMEKVLLKMTEGHFPFSNIIEVNIEESKEIIAPKYFLFPNTTESDQIEPAKGAYGF